MWWILLVALIAVLFLLLLVPLTLRVKVDGDESVRLSYLFLTFRLYPRKPQKKKKQTPAKAKKPENEAKKKPVGGLMEKYGPVGTVQVLVETAYKLPAVALKILRGGRIKNLVLVFGVTGKDAADAAINYGRVCSIFYPAYGIVCAQMKVINPQIDIHADYASEKPQIKVVFQLRLTPLHVVACVLTGIKDIIEITSSRPSKKKKKVA